MTRENIFITGFSGTGKTTTGQEVARLLGWAFVDTDDLVVESAGMTIEEIFSCFGEGSFRARERAALATAAAGRRQVVSTGGGLPMDHRSRAVMEGAGTIVLLEARPETLLRRLQDQEAEEGDDLAARPMLDSEDMAKRIDSLKAQRQFNYTLAHWTVHTDLLSPTEAAEEVVRAHKIVSARST